MMMMAQSIEANTPKPPPLPRLTITTCAAGRNGRELRFAFVDGVTERNGGTGGTGGTGGSGGVCGGGWGAGMGGNAAHFEVEAVIRNAGGGGGGAGSAGVGGTGVGDGGSTGVCPVATGRVPLSWRELLS
jgi:hypothetical protein